MVLDGCRGRPESQQASQTSTYQREREKMIAIKGGERGGKGRTEGLRRERGRGERCAWKVLHGRVVELSCPIHWTLYFRIDGQACLCGLSSAKSPNQNRHEPKRLRHASRNRCALNRPICVCTPTSHRIVHAHALSLRLCLSVSLALLLSVCLSQWGGHTRTHAHTHRQTHTHTQRERERERERDREREREREAMPVGWRPGS